MPPKQVVVVMQEDYPFGECDQCTTENTRVLVRKIYTMRPAQRKKMQQKMTLLRKLKNQYLIKIESVLEEEESIHFLYQYIPIKLETWISNINDQFIENFRDQLINLSVFLANSSIKIDFKLKNIGMDQNYGAKYFLDLNFEIDSTVNREKLKSNYIREISNLFKPYIVESSNPVTRTSQQFVSEKTTKGNDKLKSNQHVDTAISPPTNKGSKNKEKALEKYYQDVNMSVDSQNQKIMQEFMNVLDNQEEEESIRAAASAKNQVHTKTKTKQQPVPSSQPNLVKKKNNYQEPVSASHNPNATYKTQAKQQVNYFQQSKSSKYEQPAQVYPSQKRINVEIGNKNPHQKQPIIQSSNIIPQRTASEYTKVEVKAGRKSQNKQAIDKWRESFDLQNRVKNAIEKSTQVIKRFKAIKETFQQ